MTATEALQRATDWLCAAAAWFTEGDRLSNALNSGFTTSLLGAGLGALAGAWAAQEIADRAKRRDELVREIQSVNVALILAHAVVNKYLALKNQHVRAMGASLAEQQGRHIEFQRQRAAGEIRGLAVFDLGGMHFQTLGPVLASVGVLRDHVFTKVHAVGRPLSLLTTMEGSAITLNDMLARRNDLIEDFKRHGPEQLQLVIERYLGFSTTPGRVDSTYPDVVAGIVSMTDDMIFFGVLLCKDLEEHGSEVLSRYKRQFPRAAALNVSKVDFGEAERSGLLPDGGNYPTWFTAFTKRPPEPGRWARFWSWLKGRFQ